VNIDGKFHRSRVDNRAIFGNEPDSGAGLHGRGEQRADGSGGNEGFFDLVFHLIVFSTFAVSEL